MTKHIGTEINIFASQTITNSGDYQAVALTRRSLHHHPSQFIQLLFRVSQAQELFRIGTLAELFHRKQKKRENISHTHSN